MKKLLLLSTYELGHQPFGLASPAAWLRDAGFSVEVRDLSVQTVEDSALQQAEIVAVYVPMHTATRLAIPLLQRIKKVNPRAAIICYGLYAVLNEKHLRAKGAERIISGEFERELVESCLQIASENTTRKNPVVSTERLQFKVPDRNRLPGLEEYAHIIDSNGQSRIAGYTEASRGCKYKCRHCPIVPVYNGRFRIVQPEIVLADIEQQIKAGAQHITFGDPDFFNAPSHGLAIVEAMHRRYPDIRFDVTIKIEHILRYRRHLPALRENGCAFIVSAVEALDDRVLDLLQKGHSAADFHAAVKIMTDNGLIISPTFIPFHPRTTRASYFNFLKQVAELNLIENTASIQLAIRLLLPEGSPLLQLDEIKPYVTGFSSERLCHKWTHPDPSVDELHRTVLNMVENGTLRKHSRTRLFQDILKTAAEFAGEHVKPSEFSGFTSRATIPYLTEPWYC